MSTLELISPHSLNLGVFEGLRITSAPRAHEIVGDLRVKIDGHILIFEIAFFCRFFELSLE